MPQCCCTPKDQPKKGGARRLYAIIIDKRGNSYQPQTKSGVIDRFMPANDPGSLDQRLAQMYASEISSANKTSKISLQGAARDGQTGKEYIYCSCKKMPCGNRCKCLRNKVKCTRFCHGQRGGESGACKNDAPGTEYITRAMITIEG